MTFHVGQKVVRVWEPKCYLPNARYVDKGGVYTIREIRDDAGVGNSPRRTVVLLLEVDNRHLIGTSPGKGFHHYVEPGFNIKAFRPLVSRKTDISLFKSMLTDHGRSRSKVGV